MIDPLAENAYEWAPYNYVFNNPLSLIDPDGKFPFPSTELVTNISIGLSKIGSGINNLATNKANVSTPENIQIPKSTKDKIALNSVATDVTDISNGANEIKNAVAKETSEIIGNTGDLVQNLSLLAAPFTGGGSLVFAEMGATMSFAGEAVEATNDLTNGEYTKAAEVVVEGTVNAVSKGAVKKIDKSGSGLEGKEFINYAIDLVTGLFSSKSED